MILSKEALWIRLWSCEEVDSFCIAWAFCDGISAGILAWNVMNCDVNVKQMTETFVD